MPFIPSDVGQKAADLLGPYSFNFLMPTYICPTRYDQRAAM